MREIQLSAAALDLYRRGILPRSERAMVRAVIHHAARGEYPALSECEQEGLGELSGFFKKLERSVRKVAKPVFASALAPIAMAGGLVGGAIGGGAAPPEPETAPMVPQVTTLAPIAPPIAPRSFQQQLSDAPQWLPIAGAGALLVLILLRR